MIDSLDLVIRETLVAGVPIAANRVGFQPPDAAWRARMDGEPGIWINAFLVDLREDRSRRSVEVRIERDPTRRVFAPFLLRCHYLISVWNSAKDSPAMNATGAEHAMLGRIVRALSEALPLRPDEVLLPADLAGIPAAWQDAVFDTDLLPPEGFPHLGEFWQSMGSTVPWHPAVWLMVTVPVAYEPQPIDGVVTTVISSLGAGRVPDETETLLALGGVARDAGAVPVGDAFVSVRDATGRLRARATTGGDGSFVVDGLQPGDYSIVARSNDPPLDGAVNVTVPAPVDDPVDIVLT